MVFCEQGNKVTGLKWGGESYTLAGFTFTVVAGQEFHSVTHDWLHYLLEFSALRHGIRQVAYRKPNRFQCFAHRYLGEILTVS